MITLAENFVKLLQPIDAFTIRDYFISLGQPGMGCDFVITFNDQSQVALSWIRVDESIQDIMLYREAPDSLWHSAEEILA